MCHNELVLLVFHFAIDGVCSIVDVFKEEE